MYVGIGMTMGAGIGTVIFAITSNPIWIALGAGFGLIVGAVGRAIADEGEDEPSDE